MAPDRTHLSIVICGHVDSGKSTTTGHLLFKLGGIPEREMQKLQATADSLGMSSFAFAFYMDTQKEERERGVTISCTTKEFFTDSYHYTIIDAPGHRDFIKNMITGSSQADVCALMVPADGNFVAATQKGNHKAGEVPGQSRQHARLANLLGIKQLIVGINKMDTSYAQYSAYSQERYTEIRNEMADMLVKTGWRKDFIETSVPMLPISGFHGDNLIEPSKNMEWFKGVKVVNSAVKGATEVHLFTLLDALEKFVKPPTRSLDKPMRVPISGIYKIKGVGDVLAGRVEQGSVEINKEVIFVPTHTASNPCTGKIFSVEMHHQKVAKGCSGDNIGMNIKALSTTNPPKTGDVMIYKDDNTLKGVKSFYATVQIMDLPNEIKCGYCPLAFVRCARAACKVSEIKWKIGKETARQKLMDPTSLKSQETAEVKFEPQQPFVCDAFENCEGLGRVAFLEGGTAIMLGRITKVEFV